MGEEKELKNRKRKSSKKIAENNKSQDVEDKLLNKKTKKKRKSTETGVKNGEEIVSTTSSEVTERRATKERGKKDDTKRSKTNSEVTKRRATREGVKEADTKRSKTSSEVTKRRATREGVKEADTKRSSRTGKLKKAAKKKKRSELPADDVPQDSLPENQEVIVEEEVYEMSSGDEDESKGMKNWIMQYHQSRPGIMVLQKNIDDFIVKHEEIEQQAREFRAAQAAEGGWTVVEHHKGRKKTTEAESGISVGSVDQAAVLDKMSKKKNKDVGLDFYRFQKREAHRTELMLLQSKFEQDKKRIQQMRAARKFRPY